MNSMPLKIEGLRKEYILYDNGDLFDVELNRFKEATTTRKGYKKYGFYINGKTKRFYVHRLVLMTFNPVEGMENLQVNHIDGNKLNNDISNLEWCTQSENQIHAFAHGLITRKGTKNAQCRLSEKEVFEIADMIMNRNKTKEIAKKYNISESLVSAIRNKRLWGHLLVNYEFPSKNKIRE